MAYSRRENCEEGEIGGQKMRGIGAAAERSKRRIPSLWLTYSNPVLAEEMKIYIAINASVTEEDDWLKMTGEENLLCMTAK